MSGVQWVSLRDYEYNWKLREPIPPAQTVLTLLNLIEDGERRLQESITLDAVLLFCSPDPRHPIIEDILRSIELPQITEDPTQPVNNSHEQEVLKLFNEDEFDAHQMVSGEEQQ